MGFWLSWQPQVIQSNRFVTFHSSNILKNTIGRKEDSETVEEFSKHSTELKKNTNNVDLHEDKLSREKKSCV